MKLRPFGRPRARGFTLLEMLVVLVIIGLIASLVGPRLLGRVDESRVQTAQAQVKLLRGALETMRMDLGAYPTTEPGLKLLVEPPSDPQLRSRWKGPYLDDALPADPWGKPYQYSAPGTKGRPYNLYSLGQDGQPGGEGTAADIGLTPDGAN